jgi:hypothetical protein
VLEGTYLHIPAGRTDPWHVGVALPSYTGGQGLWLGALLLAPVPSSSSRMECLWSPPTRASSYPRCGYVSCCGAFEATSHPRPCPTSSPRHHPTRLCVCHSRRCNSSATCTGVSNTGIYSNALPITVSCMVRRLKRHLHVHGDVKQNQTDMVPHRNSCSFYANNIGSTWYKRENMENKPNNTPIL